MSYKVFLTADSHFGHENIIRFCNRPFTNVQEMDDMLVKFWNETVSKNDLVIHLGDFALGNKEYIENMVSRLNGRKMLVMGNHDTYNPQFYRDAGFAEVSKFPIIFEKFYMLSHEPLLLSETTPFFSAFGHVHNDSKYVDTLTSKCVCVERTNYRPFLLYEKR